MESWKHDRTSENNFFKVQKAKNSGMLSDLKKYLTTAGYEKLKRESFMALVKPKGIFFVANKYRPKELIDLSDHIHDFSVRWSFCRQGDWWLLDKI